MTGRKAAEAQAADDRKNQLLAACNTQATQDKQDSWSTEMHAEILARVAARDAQIAIETAKVLAPVLAQTSV
jgi:hypothetical protein